MKILYISFLAKNEDKGMMRVALVRNVYIHVICENKGWFILTIKPTRCTNFSNLFLE